MKPQAELFYFHGLASSGQAATARYLRGQFPGRVTAPDYPAEDCAAALDRLRVAVTQAQERSADMLLIGTSMGGYYALRLLAEFPRAHGLVINPVLDPGAQLRPLEGHAQPRYDGRGEIRLTPALCAAFAPIDPGSLDPRRIEIVVGRRDPVVDPALAIRLARRYNLPLTQTDWGHRTETGRLFLNLVEAVLSRMVVLAH